MQHRLATTCLILLFTSPIFATPNLCQKLKNHWQGEWENEHHQIFSAQLVVAAATDNQFHGRFVLGNGSEGTIKGVCDSLKPNEVLLYLRKDPPYFNSCRGTLLLEKREYLLHFFCFNPNQSGYFKLSST